MYWVISEAPTNYFSETIVKISQRHLYANEYMIANHALNLSCSFRCGTVSFLLLHSNPRYWKIHFTSLCYVVSVAWTVVFYSVSSFKKSHEKWPGILKSSCSPICSWELLYFKYNFYVSKLTVCQRMGSQTFTCQSL